MQCFLRADGRAFTPAREKVYILNANTLRVSGVDVRDVGAAGETGMMEPRCGDF